MPSRATRLFLLLGLLSAGAVAFAVSQFSRAFPLVEVELTLDRGGALAEARRLADRYGWGPEEFRQAASFGKADATAWNYVELEGGGEGGRALGLLEARGVPTYLWTVRHFREGSALEVRVRLAPDGTPVGFRLRLPEEEPGPDLPADSARGLAEAAAVAWGFNPGDHELVESSRTVHPGGRGDHTFVYLRPGSELGEADARVRLVVAGAELAGVEPYLRVPEGFVRRFDELRTRNEQLAMGASVFMFLVLILGGCGVGSFHLVRKGAAAWRPALLLGGVISLLLALSTLNALPLTWMGYDTALSRETFLLQTAVLAPVGILALGTVILGWIIASAEGLGRLAFPGHPAFWRLWSPDTASTRAVVGRTLGGYLVAGVELGFVVAFYLATSNLAGWWSPAEALVSPDLLATHQPWLQAVALSLMAGVWEEAVFRAVPIAGAALLGQRFGRPVLWIGAALVLQAVAFGAAHADYPQQPAYARVVELFPSALLWGFIYLRYGFLPVVLIHAVYNLSLFSIPLFSASSPGIWFHRSAVIAAGAIPLLVVGWHLLRRGMQEALPAGSTNAGWRGGPAPAATPWMDGAPTPTPGMGGVDAPGTTLPASSGTPAASLPSPTPLPPWAPWGALAAGLFCWFLSLTPTPDHLRLDWTRGEAVEAARGGVSERGGNPDEGWTTLVRTREVPGAPARFLWRNGGAELYGEAAGSYLPGAAWEVRLARFQGPVEERAEEWRVRVQDGGVERVAHRLPEARPGARLSQGEARPVALAAAEAHRPLPGPGLEEVEARSQDRPERLDWTFTFRDPALPLPEGAEARITVLVSGDRLTDVFRGIHLPESWQREERERQVRWILTLLPLGAVGGTLFLVALVGGVAGVARGRIPGGPVLLLGSGLAGVLLLQALNGLQGRMAEAPTTAGLGTHLSQLLLGNLVAAAVTASALALVTGFTLHLAASVSRVGSRSTLLAGGGAGVLVAGVLSLLPGPDTPPSPPASLEGAAAYLPWLASTLDLPAALLGLAALLFLAAGVTGRLAEQGWSAARTALALTALGAFLIPGGMDTPLGIRAAAGAGLGLLFFLAGSAGRRWGPEFLVGAAGGVAALSLLEPVLAPPYPGAAAGGAVGLAALAAVMAAALPFLRAAAGPRPSGSVSG